MATNLPTPPAATQQFFNGYYNQPVTMQSDAYDTVYAFFKSNTASDAAAQTLTKSIMVLTNNNNLDPIKIINDFSKAGSQSELKTLLITFFNSLRSSTSKIGFSNNTYSNQWVQRNILP